MNKLRLVLFFFMALCSLTIGATDYISDIAVAGDANNAEVAKSRLRANGYTILDVDLNKKAGGWYVYLGYKTTVDYQKAITNIIIDWQDLSGVTISGKKYSQASRLDGFNGDINRNAGGKYLYLMYTKDGTENLEPAITALNILDNRTNNSCASGYDGSTLKNGCQDLNQGAGGAYLYLEMQKKQLPAAVTVFNDDFHVVHLGGRMYEFIVPFGEKDINVPYTMVNPKITSNGKEVISITFKNANNSVDFDKPWKCEPACSTGTLYNPETFETISSGTSQQIQSGNHSSLRYHTIIWEAPEDYNTANKNFTLTTDVTFGYKGETTKDITMQVTAEDPEAPTGQNNISVVDPYINTSSSIPGYQIATLTSVNNIYAYAVWDSYLNEIIDYNSSSGGESSLQFDVPQTDKMHDLVAMVYVRQITTDTSGKQDTTYVTYNAPFTLQPFHKIADYNYGKADKSGVHSGHGWVQLWNGGPGWGTMNVGADEMTSIGKNISYSNTYINRYWGGNWTTPTSTELQELINNCTVTYEENGVRFTGKGDYSNNFIFFPWSNATSKDLNVWSATTSTTSSYYRDIMNVSDYYKEPNIKNVLTRSTSAVYRPVLRDLGSNGSEQTTSVADSVTTKNILSKLEWAIKNPYEEDAVSSDRFRVQRAYSSDYSDATDLATVELEDTVCTTTVNGTPYGWYRYTDDNEDDTSTKLRYADTKSVFDEWPLESQSAKDILTSYKYPARYIYYRVARAFVDATWGSTADYEAKWKVLLTNVLPTVTSVKVDTTDNWRNDHKRTITVKLNNPYPWEIVSPSDSNNVHINARLQGFEKRMFSWDSKAQIIIERYSPDSCHYNGTDEAAKTLTIAGSKVMWSEEEHCYYATINDVQSAPYTCYMYKAMVDTATSNYPICTEKNIYVTATDVDRKHGWTPNMAGIADLAATCGTAQGTVVVSWDTDEGLVDNFRLEKREYGKGNWTTVFDGENTAIYRDTDAEPGKVYEYRVTAKGTFRGVERTSSATTYGYNPYYGTISGKVQLTNGAGMPGKVQIRISSTAAIDIDEVRNAKNDTIIMPGLHLAQGQVVITTYTDDKGYYSVDSVPYLNSGINLAVEVIGSGVGFTNAAGSNGPVSVTMSRTEYHVDNIDFTCSDTKEVSGRVLYAGSTVPVKDVCFYVNGVQLTDANGNAITTDQSGEYSFSIPRMLMTLQARKDGHRFANDGYMGTANPGEEFTPTSDMTANLQDSTTVRLVGRVTGGSRQGNLGLGMGLSTNNLGDDLTMVLQLEGNNTAQIVYNAKNPDVTTRTATACQKVTVDGKEQMTDSTSVSYEKKRIVIYPNVSTGEFCVDLFPTKYKITELSAKGYSSLFNDGEGFQVLDLTNDTTMDVHTDSVVHYKGTTKEVAYVEHRSTSYQASYQRVYHEPATVTYQQVNLARMPLDYLGEATISEQNLEGVNTKATVAWYDKSAGKACYAFGHPVFMQGTQYSMKVTAHEDYYYNNDRSNRCDKVNLDGGRLSVYNNLENNSSKSEYLLDSLGSAYIELKVNNPCFTAIAGNDSSALRSVNMQVEVNGYYYDAEPMRGYVLGQKDGGTNVLSMDGDISVVDIVRDPYGSNSYAYRAAGTQYYWKHDKSYTVNSSFDISVTAGGGMTYYVGVGLSKKSEWSVTGTLSTSIPMQSIASATNSEYSMTLNERIQTSSSSFDQGAIADVYIGMVNTVNIDEATCVSLIDSTTHARVANAIGTGDVTVVGQGKDKNGKDFYIVIGKKLMTGEGTARSFAYSQGYIIGTLIPQLKDRYNALIMTGTPEEIQQMANDAKEAKYYIDANGNVVMVTPTNTNKGFSNEAQTILNTITQWEKIIAANEQEKIETMNSTTPFKQYSLSGSSITYTEAESAYYQTAYRYSLFGDDNFTGSVSGSAGVSGKDNSSTQDGVSAVETGKTEQGKAARDNGNGTYSGVSVGGFIGSISITPYKFTKSYGNSVTYYKKSTAGSGFTLDARNGAYMDMDVYRVSKGRVALSDDEWDFVTSGKTRVAEDSAAVADFIFVLRGGADRTPWLDADSTFYYTPGSMRQALGTRLLKIDNPKLYIDNPVVSNVPQSDKAIFSLRICNESEISDASKYLKPASLVLKVDDTSNPNGLKITMDGAPLNSDHSFLIKPGRSVVKTIEVEKGNGYDFENIRLKLSDATGTLDSYATLSVHYLPESSPVTLTLPKDKWVMNTLSANKDGRYYIPVEISGYNTNADGFDHIELQYKKSTEGESQWVNLCSFYANSELYKAATGEKAMIEKGTISYSFFGEQDPVEMNYDLRAVSFCQYGTGLISCASDVASGIKDTRCPEIFGLPKPANGILGYDGVISIPFNEPIAYNYLDKTANFSVTGYTNSSDVDHSSYLSFPGNSISVAQTKVERTFNEQDFTVGMQVQVDKDMDPNLACIFFEVNNTTGDGGRDFIFSYEAKYDMLVATVGNQLLFSPELKNELNTDIHSAMTHVGVIYCAHDSLVSFIVGDNIYEGHIVATETETCCKTSGTISIGRSFKGNICDVRVWNKALNSYEVANNYRTILASSEKDLLAYWPMDDVQDDEVEDKANGATLYLQNGVTWQTPDGISLQIDGKPAVIASDQKAKFTCDAEQDYSLSFWFKADKLDADTVALFSAGSDSLAETGLNKLRIQFENKVLVLRSEGKAYNFTDDESLADGQWHNVTVSVNNSQDLMAMFIDGSKVQEMSAENIGGMANDYVALGSSAFHGNIDELSLWHIALPADYVSSYYNTSLTGKEKELMVYMNFCANELQEDNSTKEVFSPYNGVIIASTGKTAGDKMISETDVTPDYKSHAPVRSNNGLQSLPFSWTCTDNELQININKRDEDINNQQINITLRGVEDLQGNTMKNPLMWTVYVDRNVLVWDEKTINATVKYGNDATIIATWQNKSGNDLSYTLDTSSSWIKLDKTMGQVEPMGTDEVALEISDGLSPGNYSTTINLVDENNLCSRLNINVTVVAEAPQWTVCDSIEYSNTMNIIAQVKKQKDGAWVIDSSTDDIIGAFIGKVCVGKAHITKETNGQTMAYITVRGKSGSQMMGGTDKAAIDFRLWDANNGQIYTLAPDTTADDIISRDTIRFKNGSIIGVENPVEMRISEIRLQNISLNRGWNWISLNVRPADVNNGYNGIFYSMDAFTKGDIIRRYNGFFSTYHANGKWDDVPEGAVGDINAVYQVYAQNAGTVTVNGSLISSNDRNITLEYKRNSDWAEMAYPLEVAQPISTALSDFIIGDKAPVGTFIKTFDEFAVANSKGKWVGTLKTLRPGVGYYVRRNGLHESVNIKFTNTTVTTDNTSAASARTSAASFFESNPTDANAMMPVIATVADGTLQSGDQIIALSQGQLAGLVDVDSQTSANDSVNGTTGTGDSGSSLFFISTNAETGNSIYFAIVRDGKIVAVTSRPAEYDANSVLGTLDDPYILDFTPSTTNEVYDITGYRYRDADAVNHRTGVIIVNGKKVKK